MPSLPDKLPNPPSTALIFFGGGQWDWLATSLQLIYLAARAQQPTSQDAIVKAFGTISKTLEQLMTQSSDFQGAIDRNTAATSASTAASAEERRQLQTVSQQLADAVAQLSTSQAPTQAQLDQINAASQALEDATAADVADDAPATPAA